MKMPGHVTEHTGNPGGVFVVLRSSCFSTLKSVGMSSRCNDDVAI